MRLGLPELLVILTILLLLFGAKRLPGLAKSLGKSAKEFKSALEEEKLHTKSFSNFFISLYFLFSNTSS